MRTGTPDMAAAQYAARIASGERLRLPESHIDMHCGVTPIRRANAAGVACDRPHPSRTLQSTLSRRKSEFRDRDEDCRRIWYAAEIERLR
jgi:hypothetical protein